jgi:hypothetical protein
MLTFSNARFYQYTHQNWLPQKQRPRAHQFILHNSRENAETLRLLAPVVPSQAKTLREKPPHSAPWPPVLPRLWQKELVISSINFISIREVIHRGYIKSCTSATVPSRSSGWGIFGQGSSATHATSLLAQVFPECSAVVRVPWPVVWWTLPRFNLSLRASTNPSPKGARIILHQTLMRRNWGFSGVLIAAATSESSIMFIHSTAPFVFSSRLHFTAVQKWRTCEHFHRRKLRATPSVHPRLAYHIRTPDTALHRTDR